ncbi:MAG: carboxypeptidase-like regulatory domain-containing protein [Bacteroidia bacterium]
MRILFCFLFISVTIGLSAQQGKTSAKKFTISGKVKDARNGEDLIGAIVSADELKVGVPTNTYGYFSLILPQGNYTITISYMGFETQKKKVSLTSDVIMNFELLESKNELKEVEVTADKPDARNVQATKMSVIKIEMKEAKKIPTLLGEMDIIKVVQLLPGIQQAGDGSTLYVVRGGNVDQNLILLDEAVVYNPSHVAGFFSTFNGDAIKDFEIYKGGIPANYGGRLSSVLDVRMKDGDLKQYDMNGGIGVLSSRLTVEGPIEKDKSSFIISGRRSYYDLFFPLLPIPSGTKAYFYDLNMKVNFQLSQKDRIYFSGYFGRDVLGLANQSFGTSYGNSTGTARWNHTFNSRLFVNTSLIYSRYDYSFDIDQTPTNNYSRQNYVNDVGAKVDFNFYASLRSSFKFGLLETYHTFEPGKRVPITSESVVTEVDLPLRRALEQGYYASYNLKVSHRLSVDCGLRLSVFSNIGAGRQFNYINGKPVYLSNGNLTPGIVTDTTNYTNGQIYNTNYGIEPRFSLVYLLDSKSSIKVSYNRMYQYMSLIQNINASIGQEFWTPSDKYLKPQIADQVALGYFRNFLDNTIEASAEVYYKYMQNTTELIDNADVSFKENIESQVAMGKGRAYGLELFVHKQRGKTTGWIGYTLSKSERQVDGVNNNQWYPFRYDRTHYLTIVISHQLSKRVSVSTNFIYGTGEAFTVATQRTQLFDPGQPLLPIYSTRNAARFPAYNRMDVSLTLKRKEIPGRVYKNHSEWVFAVYNVYGYKNAYTIDFEQQNLGGGVVGPPVAVMTYLFIFVPSVTYNFKF